MTYHNAQYETPHFSKDADPETLAVKANGGSLAIDVWITDGTWISPAEIGGVTLPITADTAVMLNVAGNKFRFTPSGGCEFNFGDDV